MTVHSGRVWGKTPVQSVLKCCQSTIVGGASVRVTSHRQTARFEKGVKKKTGWIYQYRVVVYTSDARMVVVSAGPGGNPRVGGLCNKKYILINCRWVVGGWDKSLVMQIFSKIWTCFKWIFSSGRQTHRLHFCVCSPVQEVAVTDTVAFQIKFEWSKACVCAIKKV